METFESYPPILTIPSLLVFEPLYSSLPEGIFPCNVENPIGSSNYCDRSIASGNWNNN